MVEEDFFLKLVYNIYMGVVVCMQVYIFVDIKQYMSKKKSKLQIKFF